MIGALHGFGFLDRPPRSHVPWQVASWLSLAAVVVFMRWPQLVPGRVQATLAITAAAVAAGLLIIERIWAPGSALGRFLEWVPLVRLGQLSYVVYLVHVPVLKILRRRLPGAGVISSTLIGLVLTLVISIAIHVLVERPALRLKERLSVEPLPPTEEGSSLAAP
jgi:peptidoglycan/LPS O-acetylase OafA/YrhL